MDASNLKTSALPMIMEAVETGDFARVEATITSLAEGFKGDYIALVELIWVCLFFWNTCKHGGNEEAAKFFNEEGKRLSKAFKAEWQGNTDAFAHFVATVR